MRTSVTGAPSRLAPDRLRALYDLAILARRFEERLQQLTMAGEVPGSLHPGAGQEIAQAAALEAFGPEDKILCGHRGLLYMLQRGVTLEQLLCDVAGKQGGTNAGKGGCMHTVAPALGLLGQSGTLGGGFVISVGVGMALRRRGAGEVVGCFFGDGTSNRGTFHESLNWASTQKLPCVYVCENNGLAVSVPASYSTAVADIADRASGYGIPGTVVDGDDPEAAYASVADAVERARAGLGPSLVELKVTRLAGHYIGDPQDYRSDAESAIDPLPVLQARLLEAGLLDDAAVVEVRAHADAMIDAAVATMRAATPVPPGAALEGLYA